MEKPFFSTFLHFVPLYQEFPGLQRDFQFFFNEIKDLWRLVGQKLKNKTLINKQLRKHSKSE
jgi:hypothetical protein